MISNSIKEKLLQLFSKYNGNVLFVYLFGTAAQGNMSPLSDVDLAVFLSRQDDKSYYEIKCSLYADCCRVLKRDDIDVVVLNTTKNIVLLDEIIRGGIVLVDRDIELREAYEQRILHQAMDFKEQRIVFLGV
ncbi:MAG: Nucleotidyltransferase domain protein [Candidatus Scalindua rubra]|uniref:Nucleotidyltransferase domain protein n=1 Tax=Candidatus Scalindua rubra TaxID=1872076 RepID=A0A1E3X4J2_9BACT|nr:MAG: Nucleotidyltransferase domain protein [Candidatus Scalindua rubra]